MEDVPENNDFVEDGKIVEHSDVIEILELMNKIGAISFNTPSQ